MPDANELRRNRILEVVRTREYIRVADLGEMFGVSNVTVRGDLDVLAARGQLRRIRGGAMPQDHVPVSDAGEELTVGRAAVALLHDGDCVLLDAGAIGAARALVESALRDVVVVTNGLDCAGVLEEAMPRLTVVLTGGTLQATQRALVEPLADLVLGQLRGHAALLTCAGVAVGAGVTDVDLRGAAAKRRMLGAAARRVVLAGAVAIGAVERAQVCPLDDVDVVVAGAAADGDVLQALRDGGIEVVVAA